MRRNFETTYENFGKYTTDLYTEEANSIIRNHNKSQPLFLTISHTAVHSANPYQLLQAPKENVDRFSNIKDIKRRTFAGTKYTNKNILIRKVLKDEIVTYVFKFKPWYKNSTNR